MKTFRKRPTTYPATTTRARHARVSPFLHRYTSAISHSIPPKQLQSSHNPFVAQRALAESTALPSAEALALGTIRFCHLEYGIANDAIAHTLQQPVQDADEIFKRGAKQLKFEQLFQAAPMDTDSPTRPTSSTSLAIQQRIAAMAT
ncbi:hypothetical protein D9611_006660 [Ephemerocybe angulata]|uniref:Uncharacterized protein n=1 Tax=Ephemerocybe angulata TaxID=980116 RepID=A0A8H5FH01_9AGAR|nr:hypothetical protein D9611_006660 [Tulosesus angulatus]